MKKPLLLSVVILLIFFAGCVIEKPITINLSGEWVSTGYQCPFGTYHEETIQITHLNDELKAIKITGDDCVPAGYQTFEGAFNSETNMGTIIWTTGNASNPGSSTANGTIEYDGEKLYGYSSTSESIIFTRK